MVTEIKDKIIVVTGGVGGIGFEIANKLLDKGAKVAVLLDVNETQGIKAIKELTTKYSADRTDFIKCDVTSDLEGVFKRIIRKYTYIDVLVNSAGIVAGFQTHGDMNRNVIDINVTATIQWTMTFWEHMRTDKGGKGGTIINVSSTLGYRVSPFSPVYQASKFAVLGFTKSIGHKYNFERSGVRVVVLCPGFTDTNFNVNLLPLWEENIRGDLEKALKQSKWQKVDVVGRAAVEVFEKADSGTAWIIEGDQPITEFTGYVVT